MDCIKSSTKRKEGDDSQTLTSRRRVGVDGPVRRSSRAELFLKSTSHHSRNRISDPDEAVKIAMHWSKQLPVRSNSSGPNLASS